MPDRSDTVSRMAPAEIGQLAFGVRYEPQHKLLDHIGTVDQTDFLYQGE
jgi:hypothetical protein